VFDTNASYVKWQYDYSKELKEIKGIIPYGSSFDELSHLIFDVNGKVYKHKADSEEKPEMIFEA
jgi:hypothetical protein